MVKSKSGRKIFECEICDKSKSSHSRGKYWLQKEKDKLLLTCYSCKRTTIINIKPIELKTHRGLIFCCFNKNLFKIIETNNHITAECTKCGNNIIFEKVK